MSYELGLSPLAERQLAGQPEPLRSFTLDALNRLAGAPASLSRPSASITRGQFAEFRFDLDRGTSLWVAVTFLYGADEQTLHVEHIAVEFGG